MSGNVQLAIALVIVFVAVCYLIRYIYRMTRKGSTCDGCTLKGACDRCNVPPRKRKA